MPRKWPPYVSAVKDKAGKMRFYLRRAGQPLIPLDGKPGTREFSRAYRQALNPTTPKPVKVRLTPRNGHVYYLSDGENVKIGFTQNWGERQKKYLTHSGRDLTLLALQPGYRTDETRLHQQFKIYRKRGDWFYPGKPIMDHIKSLIGYEDCIMGSEKLHNDNLTQYNQTTIETTHLKAALPEN